MLLIPPPKTTAVADQLLTIVRNDYNLGALNSIIYSIINPLGVTWNTSLTAGTQDPGEYHSFRFGDRGNLPAGLSVFTIPLPPTKTQWEWTPLGASRDVKVLVRCYWMNDTNNNVVLTSTPGRFWRMMSDLAEAFEVVLGHTNIGSVNGVWSVGGGYLADAGIEQTWRCRGFYTDDTQLDRRNVHVLYNEHVFTGTKYLVNP